MKNINKQRSTILQEGRHNILVVFNLFIKLKIAPEHVV